MSGLRPTVRQCLLVSVARDGRCYSLSHSVVDLQWRTSRAHRLFDIDVGASLRIIWIRGGAFLEKDMSGFLSVVGLSVMVVAVLSLFGRARWAHISSRRLAWLVLAAGFGIGIAGGALASSSPPPSSTPAPSPTPSRSAPTTSPAAPSRLATTSSPAAPVPARTTSRPKPTRSSTGTLRWQAKVALPDQKITPGAVFPGVTASQVCTLGWAEAHRNVPDEVDHQVFAEYGLSYAVHDSYEVDHLIPLELGGSNSIRNLWPEPQGGSSLGYPSKDRLENRLHQLVCSGSLSLAVAQHAIAANWWAAYQTYLSSPAPSQPTHSAPRSSPTPPPATVPAPPTSTAPVGCHPLTNGGNCYEPGEYCRTSDHGVSGVAGDGEAIICEYNNGWRWEPA